jgi:hypothetical protein
MHKSVNIYLLAYCHVLNGLLICSISSDSNHSNLINLLNNFSVQYSYIVGNSARTPAKLYEQMFSLHSRLQEWLDIELLSGRNKAETDYDDSKRNTSDAWTSRQDVYKGESYDNSTLSVIHKDLKTQTGFDSIDIKNDRSKDIDKLFNMTFKSEGDSEEEASEFVLEFNQKRFLFNQTSEKPGDSRESHMLDSFESAKGPLSPVFRLHSADISERSECDILNEPVTITIKLPIEEIREVPELTEREADSLLPIVPSSSKLQMCRSQQILPRKPRKNMQASESL